MKKVSDKMNILILTVSAGAGHIKAAEAIRDRMMKKYPNAKIMVVDTYKYVNPLVDKLVVGSYLKTVRNVPSFYGKLYALSEQRESKYNFGGALNRILAVRLRKLIKDFKPSLIACTNFIPLQILSNMHRKGGLDVPTVSIITDFTTHAYWLHEYVSAYVVAHDLIKYELIKKGISEKIIHPLGIPVSDMFENKKSKSSLLKEFKLEDKKTILIMGGSLGFGDIQNNFVSLLNYPGDIQIIVIAGTNYKLMHRLTKYSQGSLKKVKIVGYTDRVSDYMEVSDVIITKPGGMTVSEALIKELPILIISPIPGQEERNARFLTNMGAAARIMDDDDADNILYQIIDNPARIKQMKETARFLAKPSAAEKIAGLLGKISVEASEDTMTLAFKRVVQNKHQDILC